MGIQNRHSGSDRWQRGQSSRAKLEYTTDLDHVNKFKLTWQVGVLLCHHLPPESASSFCSSSPARPLAQALHQNLTKAHPQHQT